MIQQYLADKKPASGLAPAAGRFEPIAIIAAALAEYDRLGHATLPQQPTRKLDAWRLAARGLA